MVIPAISLGKLIFLGINAYKANNYTYANDLLDKALSINKSNFMANFWKMRAAVMQKEYETAITLINTCRILKSDTEMENLLDPWEQLCLNKINQEEPMDIDIINLNIKTDALLEHYQHHRVFGLLDVLEAILLFFGLVGICFLLWHPKNILTEVQLMANIILLVYTPIILHYYYRSATLVPNIYILLQYSVNRIRNLLCTKHFIGACLLISFIAILKYLRAQYFPWYYKHLNLWDVGRMILLTPISEEIFFRGILYGYFRKYGRTFSWVIVSLAFYFSHWQPGDFYLIVFSLLLLFVYDREKTILAPVILHVLNNIFFIFDP